MMKKLPLFAIALLLAVAGAARLSAETGPNGTNPRPFYVIGHNPNTLEMAELALLSGANALEPDVIVLPDNSYAGFPPVLLPDPPGMVMYHDYSALTARVPLTLQEYLAGVHALAKQYPQLALLMLDVKPQAAKKENGQKILDAIHQYLNYDDVMLNVIINVGSRVPDAELFTDIYSQLGEREGVQVDGEDNPALVVAALAQAEGGNIGYGDGTLGPGPNVPKAIDWGAFLRASWGFPRTISDVYTVANGDMMDFFIEAGADGIIPDHFIPIPPIPMPGLGLTEFDLLSAPYTLLLASKVPFHPEIRYATRDDNPFKPSLEAYGLKTRTLDVDDGDTDAPLTFTLEGCRGSSDVTFHTGIAPNLFGTGRMEKGETDHVTIPSLNLGKLTKLHIFNHGGFFNRPDWALEDVAVSSARWLGSDIAGTVEYGATFNAFIKSGETKTLDLTPNFQEPEPTIECQAPITVNNEAGKCSAVVNFAPKVDGMCPDVTATSVPASGTAFVVGTTNVTSTAASPSFPQSHPMCTLSVTVKDVEAPLIACPAPMTVDATGPLGVTASFAPTAGDNCSATVSSVPASGSVFAIGTTTVSSTAQDPSGNQASCSFTVHVKGAAEQIADLIIAVTNLSAKDGTRTSLLAKLQTALAHVQVNDTSACGTLAAFINEVTSHSGKDISVADADALIAKATQIRAVLGC